jgi:uncharacterized protein (DUF2345 family)
MSTKVVGGGFNPYIGSDAISAARTLSQGGVSGSYGETVLSVTGAIVAEQFKTALASASIIFPSGSTRFGNDDENDTHHFRGSIFAVTASVIAFGSSSVQFSNEFPPGAHKADGTANNLWGSDVTFFVSGSVGGKRTTAGGVGVTGGGGVALFGGDLVTSGTLFARDVTLWSGETRSFVITSSAGDAYISSSVSNKDMIFMVNDGGTMTEVFRLDGDVSALKVAANKKLMLGAAEEYLYGDGTDIHISLGAGGDINVPTDIGITFGNDGEKIEGDGTDLTIASSGELNLSVTGDIAIANQTTKVEWGGAGSGEHIVGAGTNELTIAAGADINLTPSSGDVNIPSNIGLTFGADGEKIEGDGTNLTIAGGTISLDSEGDITLDAGGADIFFKDDGTEVGSLNLTGTTNMTLRSKGDLTFDAGSDKTIIFKHEGSQWGEFGHSDNMFIMSASQTDNTIALYASISGSSKQYAKFGSEQVMFMSGWNSSKNSPDPKEFTDTNFFVSGTIGGKDSDQRGVSGGGVSVFGGDTVVSGNLYTPTGQYHYFKGDQSQYIRSNNNNLVIETDDYLYIYADSNVNISAATTNINSGYDGGSFNVYGNASTEYIIKTDNAANKMFILSGTTGGVSEDEWDYADTAFFVSGSKGSKGTDVRGTSLFGGDVVVSGSTYAVAGFSGSLTKTTSGLSYLVAGSGMTVTSGSNGQITLVSTSASPAADDISAGDAAVTLETSTGNITVDSNAGSVTVDGHTGVTLQSTNSGDITLDSVADIILDAGGADIVFKDDGTEIGGLHLTGTTNMTLSSKGYLTLNTDNDVIFFKDGTQSSYYEAGSLHLTGTTNMTLSSKGDLSLDANGSDIFFKDSGTEVGSLNLTGTTNMTLRSKGDLTFNVDDDNIYFQSEGTEFGFISSTGANEFALSASVSDKHFMVYASVSGSSKEYARFGKEQVLIMSGWSSSKNSPDPKEFTDTNFFVSGTIGGKDSDQRGVSGGGVSVFGGDIVTSGTVYVDVPATRPAAAFGNMDAAVGVGADATIWVSGSIYTKGGSTRGTSIFGGDVVVSGALDVKQQTVTLTNNTTSATVVSGALGAIQFNYGKTYHAQIRYGVKRNRDVEGGQILMSMAPNGSSADVTVITNIVSVDAQNPGVTFSADVSGGYARLNYTCVNSGSHHATMNYAIEQEFTY